MIEELKSRNSTNQELIISLKSQVDLQETQHDHALKQIDILKEEKESLKSTVKIKDDQIHLYEKRIQICENGLSEVKENLDALAVEKEEMKESYETEIENKNVEIGKLETKIEQQYDELETMISDLQSLRTGSIFPNCISSVAVLKLVSEPDKRLEKERIESSLNNKIKNQAADISQLSQRLEIIYKGLKTFQTVTREIITSSSH